MKNNLLHRLACILLAALLLLPLGLQTASATGLTDEALGGNTLESSFVMVTDIPNEEAPVFIMRISDGDTTAYCHAFYFYDPTTKGNYLISRKDFGELIEMGYECKLYGDDYSADVTYVAEMGELALYYAPELDQFTPMVLGTTYPTKLAIAYRDVESNSYSAVKLEQIDVSSGWINTGDGYFTTHNSTLSSTTTRGAVVLAREAGTVCGLLDCTDNMEPMIWYLVGLKLSYTYSINELAPKLGGSADAQTSTKTESNTSKSENKSGNKPAASTEPAAAEPEAEAETTQMNTSLIIVGVLAVIALVAYFTQKSRKKAAVTAAASSSDAPEGTVPLYPDQADGFGPPSIASEPSIGATRAAAKWQIRCVSGKLSGQVFPLYGTLKLGRSSKCDVVFPEDTPGVSGTHCELTLEGDRVALRDLGSSYGTYLAKNVKMESRINYYLNKGDTFSLAAGGQTFRLENAGAYIQDYSPAVRNAEGEIFRADMNHRITFGRGSGNQVSFGEKDSAVSSNHCVLYRDNGSLYLKDTGSTNGTFFSENERLKPNTPYKVKKGMTFFLVSRKNTFTITED